MSGIGSTPIGVYGASNNIVVKHTGAKPLPDPTSITPAHIAPTGSSSSSLSISIPSHASVSNDFTTAFININRNQANLSSVVSSASITQVEIYSLENDETVSSAVAKRGHFGTPSDHREKSGPVYSDTGVKTHNSGFHEVLPTNVYKELRKELSSGKFSGHNQESVQMLVEIAGDFRTDTAMTLMSMDKSSAKPVAGHTHSGFSTKGQKDAHDLLRNKIDELASLDPKTTPGLTKESLACVIGSMAVSSMPPAVDVEQSQLGTGTDLTAPGASDDWDARRNEAKDRVIFVTNNLSPNEIQFVANHGASFLSVLGRPNEINQPVSPRRDTSTTQVKSNFVGGDYETLAYTVMGGISTATAYGAIGSVSASVADGISRMPSVFPPALTRDLGFYFTQSFRGIKQV